jgi:hypothetical protein
MHIKSIVLMDIYDEYRVGIVISIMEVKNIVVLNIFSHSRYYNCMQEVSPP